MCFCIPFYIVLEQHSKNAALKLKEVLKKHVLCPCKNVLCERPLTVLYMKVLGKKLSRLKVETVF